MPSKSRESEEQLISISRNAVSRVNWEIGEAASKWMQRFSRGRGDAEFGALVGLTGDQIFQRRRVWEAFGADRDRYPGLLWSFFYAALNWDDADECLLWANEVDATVAEMRAWRRAQRGEDLFAALDDDYTEWGAPVIR